MVRPPSAIPTEPLDIIIQHGRLYEFGPGKKYTQVQFFSCMRSYCSKLLIFGGSVYSHKKGYTWMCSNKAQLLALYKLLEGVYITNDHMIRFRERMAEYNDEISKVDLETVSGDSVSDDVP